MTIDVAVETAGTGARSGAMLLEVEELSVSLGEGPDAPRIVDHISFAVAPGEARGFVGESGSGKSVTLRAILGLMPPSMHVTSGRIRFAGEEIVSPGPNSAQTKRLRALRGAGISMIFQEPSVALNPVIPVGEQIVDAARQRQNLSRKQARDYSIELMTRVGIPDPATKYRSYVFELSGGLRQRVMIAAAIASKPQLVLCDEPTTALDVTVQQQILRLFTDLRSDLDAALLYVTHDLAVVSELCDSLTVLYSGRVMETRRDIRGAIDQPFHPYTRALLDSTPDIDRIERRLRTIPGTAPQPTARPDGCPFAPRCDNAQSDCHVEPIPGLRLEPQSVVFCKHPLVRTTSVQRPESTAGESDG